MLAKKHFRSAKAEGLFSQGRSKGESFKNIGGMEAALVSGILEIVGTNLAPLVIKEFSSVAGVAKDLQELQDLVEEINTWLQTVAHKAVRNDQSYNWIKKLKDAAYDAEDLVHEFRIESEKHDVNVVGVKNIVVRYLWTKPKSVVFECETAHRIKDLKKRFDAIVKGRNDYNTIANSMPVDYSFPRTSKTTGEVPLWTNVNETSIFGSDQVKNQIISEMIETNGQQNVKIVSANGIGGSRKTTLAKLVFSDTNIIKEHFDVILWVHVSREFVVEKLVEKLFEAIAGDKTNHLTLQHVSRTISDKLVGKRFLLVLDVFWTEDRIHWEQFIVHLKSGAPGSSILLTTRSRKVAEAVDSTYTCDLPYLSVDSGGSNGAAGGGGAQAPLLPVAPWSPPSFFTRKEEEEEGDEVEKEEDGGLEEKEEDESPLSWELAPPLSVEDNWKVFQQSFGMPMKDLDPEFQEVGIEIVNRCGGLPLAIKVLAGVLHGIKRMEERKSIRNSNFLDVEDEEHRLYACLWLSYIHLPHHLKLCFTHFSIFPRGYVMNRCRLISQWIGLVIPSRRQVKSRDQKMLEVTTLILFLKVGFLEQYQSSSGEVTTCKMHDLVHDLTRQILHDEFVSEIATPAQTKRCRYLSLISCTGKVDIKLFDKARALYVSRGNLASDKIPNKRSCVCIIILEHKCCFVASRCIRISTPRVS